MAHMGRRPRASGSSLRRSVQRSMTVIDLSQLPSPSGSCHLTILCQAKRFVITDSSLSIRVQKRRWSNFDQRLSFASTSFRLLCRRWGRVYFTLYVGIPSSSGRRDFTAGRRLLLAATLFAATFDPPEVGNTILAGWNEG